jgi:pyridinium-3,5-bisthiocarboxylic acid mononucleotide nickel chelatase
MKTLYIDCFCGISGDMTVAALLDAGAPGDKIITAINAMRLEGVSATIETVSKAGIRATRFVVGIDPDVHQHHRHLPDIIAIINAAPLPETVKSRAIQTFTLLGEAEAQVHGTTIDKVHFHEVGAADSIVDIVAANLALHELGIERIFCSALVTGSGTIQCDHGLMPVPAPATALLLDGIPWTAGDISTELATPTGVALAKCWSSGFGAMPIMTTTATGYGAGTRDLPDRANVLRVFVGETQDDLPQMENICVLETVIDDMNPELTALLIPAAMEAGARDAFITPVIAKKGRAAHCLTVLCEQEYKAAVVKAVFENSTTLGIRMREETRCILKRKTRRVNTSWGCVNVKIGMLHDTVHNIAPEFESCHELARQYQIAPRRIYDAAMAAAQKGDFVDE